MADEFVTKDSGERAEFGNDFVRDTNEGKPRFDLVYPKDIPFSAQYLTRVAELMERGAHKYNERNWERARGQEAYERFKESAFRHFMEWYLGVSDGEDHAAAVFFNLQGAEFVKWHMEHTTKTYTVSVGDYGGGAGGASPGNFGGASGSPGWPAAGTAGGGAGHGYQGSGGPR